MERLADTLSLGDIHFVSLIEGFEGLEVPSKAYGALAVGRPLIYQGNVHGEIAQMILETDIGYVIPQGDVDQLEKVVLDCLSHRDQLAPLGERALYLAETDYSCGSRVNQYVSLLREYQPEN